MDPLITASLVGAAGSFASGILGNSSSRADRELQRHAIDQNRDLFFEQMRRYDQGYQDQRGDVERAYTDSRNDLQQARWDNQVGPARQMQHVIHMAGQNGIHPLAALGVQSGYSPAGSSGPVVGGAPGIPSGSVGNPSPVGDGGAAAHIGDAISSVASALSKEEQEKRERRATLEKKQIDYVDAQIRELDAATSRTQLQTLRNASQGTGTLLGTTGEGIKADPKPLIEQYQLPDGSIVEVPVGADLDEVISGGIIYAVDRAKKVLTPKPGQKPARDEKRGSSNKNPPIVYKTPKPSHRKPIKR